MVILRVSRCREKISGQGIQNKQLDKNIFFFKNVALLLLIISNTTKKLNNCFVFLIKQKLNFKLE
jgi:hypothetical protein